MSADRPLLVVGSKHLSSWSLRPWLALKVAGVEFDEETIPLNQPETAAQIRRHSPSGKVPCLVHRGVAIWDSLAICEYAAETWSTALWPADAKARAVARAVSAEMHAGFADLRRLCPMNLQLEQPEKNAPPPGTERDVARILELWRDCRQRFGEGGPFLFGAFTIADAMFAPVVTRFRTYGVPIDENAVAYGRAIEALPAMEAWRRDAR